VGQMTSASVFELMNGLHYAAFVEIRGADHVVGGRFPQAVLTRMILFNLRSKGSAAHGAKGRGDLGEPVKAWPTKEEFFVTFLGPVFPKEFTADSAPGRIDQVNEGFE
jgi:hypothetical protein